MNKRESKILKTLLFIGVFAYLVYHDIHNATFSFSTVTGALLMASFVYIMASLFGILLTLTRNYLITIIATLALTLLGAFKLDALIAAVPWLSEDVACIILIIIVLFCILKDFIIPQKVIDNNEVFIQPTTEDKEIDPNVKMRNSMKANPQSVFNITNMVEKELGRKPTYEEVMARIDDFVIPEDVDF